VVVAVLGLPRQSVGQTEAVSRFQILVKTLGYDRGFRSRFPEGLRIGVVHSRQTSESTTEAQTIVKQGRMQAVQGKEIQAVAVELSGKSALQNAVIQQSINVLYLCRALTPQDVDVVLSLAQAGRLPVLAGSREQVVQGAAMGVVSDAKGKSRIVVNANAAKGMGLQFESRLLRLVQLVDSPAKAEAAKPIFQSAKQVQARRLSGRDPEYPRIARTAGLNGEVMVKLTISADGKVSEAKIMRGHEVFHEVVLEAMQQWQFKPHLIGGRPVPTFTVYKIRFSSE